MRKIAAVIGSSGIGKSKLAVELCKAFSGQVINADALQVSPYLTVVDHHFLQYPTLQVSLLRK